MKIIQKTILLDLRKSEEELWKDVQKDNRWSVNKARKNKIRINLGGDINTCYNLYLKTCKDNNLVPNTKEKLFKKNILITSLFNSEIVGFSLIGESGNTAKLLYNSTNSSYKKLQSNALLYWESFMIFKKKGFLFFDLGGIDTFSKYRRNNDRFKERWGGSIKETQVEVNLFVYLWWRFLRHSSLLRKVKFILKKAK